MMVFNFIESHEQYNHQSLQMARYARVCCKLIDLDPSAYGTHIRRRTKATLVYRRTKNLRAVQLWLSHTKLESTVRYYGEPPVMLKNFPR
ncbi:MAG: hypothetical protein NTV66_01620 [Methylococcales bacterium]|jgi:integrase|nr:hypothetical protein [Methylococcales bacterium]